MNRWKSQDRSRAGSGKPKTLVETLGKCRIVIERHRGIACYCQDEIMVKTTYGALQIKGEDLHLCCMNRDQLCITGRIDELKLNGRDDGGPVE